MKTATVMTTYHMDVCVHCGAVVRTLLLVPEVPGSSLGWAIFSFFSVRSTIFIVRFFLQWVELGCGHSQLCSVAH